MTVRLAYAAIKSKIVDLTGCFAQYYRLNGIRCNALAPSGIRHGQVLVFDEGWSL